ncbi:MAG: hypothetical protein A2Y77_00225 [Planctomycetes bacterium RBG_13_62_9]|nr:MAG: hypothetical protein A2Y77_00225 [Planctomycetes bacterium RBG_13_62_9]
MKARGLVLSILVSLVLAGGCAVNARGGGTATVTGELKQWHDMMLTFDGPATDEAAEVNPFLDYRLDVMFAKEGKQYVVPGYYAADGNAGQTSAAGGSKWQVRFLPPEPGVWTYTASFRTGTDIATDSNVPAGKPVAFDGATGTFKVEPTDKTGRDFRAQGLLQYAGGRYLRFAHTGTYFIKAGADSPENFLAYAEFDQTFDTAELKREGEAAGAKFIHRYQPHVQDWRPGDPTWRNGKGKGIIGALNYLASKRMNSVYFLTYNIDGGDGKDVWPWTDPNERFRFDCSKLAQWEIVFSHMDRLALMLHVITQEQENDQGLDGGELGRQRRLYYRELIARFAHHPALVWNLGEENTNTTEQLQAFSKYIHDVDPYDHPVVCHTFPGQYDKVYMPLLGYEHFEGPSLQTNDTHGQTIKWIDLSAAAGRQWFVCLDEIGPAHTGVKPDKDDYWHDQVRKEHLWGNLMAGGAGVEWYFGYNFIHNDLNCEDWRSRDHLWDITRHALEFFRERLPFATMSHHDELTSAADDYCLADPERIYAVYLPAGGTTSLDLGTTTAAFRIRWFNPRKGGPLQIGTLVLATGPGTVDIGQPPEDTDKDWLALVERSAP